LGFPFSLSETFLKRNINSTRNEAFATISSIQELCTKYNQLNKEFPNCDFGLHLHTTPTNWYEKVDSAYKSNCLRFDTVLKGFGGCPMSGKDLVGNLDTNNLVHYLEESNIEHNLNIDELIICNEMANRIFSKYN